MTIEALTQFMLSQGPSQAVVSLEWDSIWTLNKKIIDPVAPRHWAVVKKNNVPVTIQGGPQTLEVKSIPKHKKNADVGVKKTTYSSSILVEQEDAASFEDQEEITLMDWGNAIVRSKVVDTSGLVTSIEMELNLEGDFRKTKKKITWLASPTQDHPLPTVSLVDFDYIITKKKLEETDDVADFVTPVSEFKEEAYADANALELTRGEIMQFERKGYYVFDQSVNGVLEFFKIPDGKAAGIASKANNVAATPPVVNTTAAKPYFESKMYHMEKIYGDDAIPEVETRMYKMQSVYQV